MKLGRWIAAAFDTKDTGGMSMRKFLAFWTMVLITLLHTKYLASECKDKGDFALIPQFLWVDYTAIGTFLGLVIVTDILRFLNREKGDTVTEVKQTTEIKETKTDAKKDS